MNKIKRGKYTLRIQCLGESVYRYFNGYLLAMDYIADHMIKVSKTADVIPVFYDLWDMSLNKVLHTSTKDR